MVETAAVVGLGNDGTMGIKAVVPEDMALDVDAYFTAKGGAGLVPLSSPVRFVDTRGGDALYVGGAFSGGEVRSYRFGGASYGGAVIPTSAVMIVVTITAVP